MKKKEFPIDARFKSQMALHEDNLRSLSKKMKIAQATLYSRINGDTEWHLEDVITLQKLYDLNLEDIKVMFPTRYDMYLDVIKINYQEYIGLTGENI